MGILTNSVYEDTKNVEELYFLKVVYDMFPSGTYPLSKFFKKVEESRGSIMKWRSDTFGDMEYIGDAQLTDYFYNETKKCVRMGLISQVGRVRATVNTITRSREEVETALSNPWRSLETDVDGFSRGEGMVPSDVAYYRDLIAQAKEYHGREGKSISEFFNMPVSEYRNTPQTGMVATLYKKGFLELSGTMRLSATRIPAFVPFRVRLKEDLFRPDISERIERSGYRSEKWDGNLPSSYDDVETLEKMFDAQPFSGRDIESGRLFRMGYLEKTVNYLSPTARNDKGSAIFYRLKDDFVKALFEQYPRSSSRA
ncbi:MAG: hypothetical protein HY833_00615 [Candidatus Aenigmarchaeota archaeon]|nr:hypothetical protein [Candidatus Aenigmarchaeota archaeon]